MFLTQEQIKSITGSRPRRLQRRWLEKHKIPYTVANNGHINVLTEAVVVRHTKQATASASADAPNFKRYELREEAHGTTSTPDSEASR